MATQQKKIVIIISEDKINRYVTGATIKIKYDGTIFVTTSNRNKLNTITSTSSKNTKMRRQMFQYQYNCS